MDVRSDRSDVANVRYTGHGFLAGSVGVVQCVCVGSPAGSDDRWRTLSKLRSTWWNSKVVAGIRSDRRTTQARATGSTCVVTHPRGARRSHSVANSSEALLPSMLEAATVLSGPAATRLD